MSFFKRIRIILKSRVFTPIKFSPKSMNYFLKKLNVWVQILKLYSKIFLSINLCELKLESFQIFVCESLANLYLGNASQVGTWELRFTGIPVVVLDLGETRSRSKRRIQILLAERGTCFTLWRETIDNLSAYKVHSTKVSTRSHALKLCFLKPELRLLICRFLILIGQNLRVYWKSDIRASIVSLTKSEI